VLDLIRDELALLVDVTDTVSDYASNSHDFGHCKANALQDNRFAIAQHLDDVANGLAQRLLVR